MSGVGHIVVIPDCQMATDYEHSVFIEQIDYIIRQAPDLVVFTGDMTDTNLDATWVFVAAQLARLTAAGIKWVPVYGNHDYDWTSHATARVAGGDARLTAPAWIGGLKDAGALANSYTFVTLGGRQWLVLALEYSPTTATVAWANGIVAAHPTVPVILVTHAFLYRDGTRYDYATKGESQEYNPHSLLYQLTPSDGINDGEQLWQGLVLNHSNIRVVLSGHDVFATASRTDKRQDGTACHQIVQDYQEFIPNSWGLTREYRFDEVNQAIFAATYSASGKRYLVNAGSTFSLPMP